MKDQTGKVKLTYVKRGEVVLSYCKGSQKVTHIEHLRHV